MRVAAQMRELEAQVRTCPLCRLSKTRIQAVPGEGDYGAEIMFIGEGPGYHEDKQGRPFVGNAGEFLNELLGIAGVSRNDVYITNVVKCRPPNNRDPLPDEIAACAPYLDRQIALINPRMIVTLGRYSMSRFFPGERISQIHGKARVVEGRLCVAMYHPAAGLHQASLADVIRADFRLLPIYLEQSRKLLAHEQAAPAPPEPIHEVVTEPAAHAATTPVVEPDPEQDLVFSPPQEAASEPVLLREEPTEYNRVENMSPSWEQAAMVEPEAQPQIEPPSAQTGRKRAAKAKKDKYTQMHFFDL